MHSLGWMDGWMGGGHGRAKGGLVDLVVVVVEVVVGGGVCIAGPVVVRALRAEGREGRRMREGFVCTEKRDPEPGLLWGCRCWRE